MTSIDVANNIKAVELIKVEILRSITDLCSATVSEPDVGITDRVLSSSADLIALSYLIAKRLGVSYEDINTRIREKLEFNISENHNLERRFGDLSELLEKIK